MNCPSRASKSHQESFDAWAIKELLLTITLFPARLVESTG
jgi:hypothetical protein